LNQEGINNLNRSIPSKDVETVKKNLPTKNRLVPAGFTADFYQTFKELIQCSLNYSMKYKRKGYYQSLSMKPVITSISKPGKDTSRKENDRTIHLMNTDAKILNKIIANRIQ
jgi:hypothetical protein